MHLHGDDGRVDYGEDSGSLAANQAGIYRVCLADKDAIQAFAAQCAREPLRECVVPHRRLHLIRMTGSGVCG